MHTAHSIHSHYCTKIHYAFSKGRGMGLVRTRCGKLLPLGVCTAAIPEITCKVCRSCFAYWRGRS